MSDQLATLMNLEPPFAIALALKQIESQYDERCYIKPKMLAKFGRFDSLGTSTQTIQEHGGTETMLTDNLIDTIVSSAVGDGQTYSLEGHTVDGSGNLTFAVQTGTLTGTTNVTLTTPLARATRLVNTGTTVLAGVAKVVDATSPSVIYVQADGTHNRSQKAATSISQTDYWIITHLYGGVLKKTSASVDFSLQVKTPTGVWIEEYGWEGVATAANGPHILDTPIIIPSNSDVKISGIASTTGVEAIARMGGYLAISGQLP
tara:strand:+ start:1920 stop:2702 length:783 start_codon:yes stop_codon:yes gene_type:complete